MRRTIVAFVGAVILMAAVVFIQPVAAQGGCQVFGQTAGATASSLGSGFGELVSSGAPVNTEVHQLQVELCG